MKKYLKSGFNTTQDIKLEAGTYSLVVYVKSLFGNTYTFALGHDGAQGVEWTEYDVDVVKNRLCKVWFTFTIRKNITKFKPISSNFSASLPVYVADLQLTRGNVPVESGASPFDFDEIINDLHDEIDSIEDFTNEAFKDGLLSREEKTQLRASLDAIGSIVESVKGSYDKLLDNPFIHEDTMTSITARYYAFIASWISDGDPRGLKPVILWIVNGDNIVDQNERDEKDRALNAFNDALYAYNQAEKEVYNDVGENSIAPIIDENGMWAFWSTELQEFISSEFSAEGDDGHSPYIDVLTGTWWEWNPEIGEFKDTFIKAEGEDGKDGVDGEDAVAPIIINGNWAFWDNELQEFVESEFSAIGDDGHAPEIRDGYWYEWNPDINDYQNTGVKAEGKDGKDGEDGEDAIAPIIIDGFWAFWNKETETFIPSEFSAIGDDGHAPEIRDGYWYEWNPALSGEDKYQNTGIKAEGEDGADGEDALVGFLTNENITLQASSDGTVGSFATATGTFELYEGLTKVTTGKTYQRGVQTNCTATIDPATGVYSVTSMSADNASVPFTVFYKSVAIVKTLTLSKSRAGSSAPLLVISESAQIMICNDDNIAETGQTIEIEAKLQNVTGTATFVAKAYNDSGSPISGDITLGGTGNVRTLTNLQWLSTYKKVVITVTLGSLTDATTIHRLNKPASGGIDGVDGVDAVVGFLTNENITVQASATGVVSSLDTAVGYFRLYSGVTPVTSEVTFSRVSQTGCTVTINATTGYYTVNTVTADNATAIFKVKYGTLEIEKVLTLSKSKAGEDGTDGDGITSTTIEYAKSSNGTTPPSDGWGTSIPSPTMGWYLWTRTTTTYKFAETTVSYSVSHWAEDGDGIVSTTIEYAKSSSGTTIPTSGWSTSLPTPTKGMYLWTRTTTVYKKSPTTVAYTISYWAEDGDKGDTGDKGSDGEPPKISSGYPKTQYAIGDSKTIYPTIGWGDAIIDVTESKPYLWSRQEIKYDSGDTLYTGYLMLTNITPVAYMAGEWDLRVAYTRNDKSYPIVTYKRINNRPLYYYPKKEGVIEYEYFVTPPPLPSSEWYKKGDIVWYEDTDEERPLILGLYKANKDTRFNPHSSDWDNVTADYAPNGVEGQKLWEFADGMELIITDALMANFGKIASAVFSGDHMISQFGEDQQGNQTSSYKDFGKVDENENPLFTPNIDIDFLSGLLKAMDVDIRGTINATSGSIGVLDVDTSGQVKLEDPDTEKTRLSFIKSKIPLLADLLSTTNFGGSAGAIGTSISIPSSGSSTSNLSGTLNVDKNGADIIIAGGAALNLEGSFDGTADPSVIMSLYLMRNGSKYRNLQSVMISKGTNIENSTVYAQTLTGMPSGNYTLMLEITKVGTGLVSGQGSVASIPMSWAFQQSGIRNFLFGLNGFLSYFSDRHIYFSEEDGFDLRGKTNMPGLLGSASVIGGQLSNEWGRITSIATYTGGYRVTISGMTHDKYTVQITSHTTNQWRVGTKTTSNFIILGTGNCDIAIMGNNY